MSTISEQSTRHHGAADCKPLIAAATRNLFRKNVFRITGLSIDATISEATRHADKLKMMVELNQHQNTHRSAFPLDPPPSIDDIREALQKFKDPENRLIDEFFWFWPEEFGDGKSDPAIQALAKGDSNAAFAIWEKKANASSNGIVAKHNLAIGFHLLSIEMAELTIGRVSTEEYLDKTTEYLKSSVRKWGRIVEEETLWEKVADRIRQLNEPSLSTGFARRMRGSLSEALGKIDADLILAWIESGKSKQAKELVQYIREKSQRALGFNRASERVLLPLKNRLKERIRQALEQAEKSPAGAKDAALDLIKQSRQTLDIFDVFFDKQNDYRNDVFDEFVSACNRIQIIYHRETTNDAGCLEILKVILPLVTSAELKQIIEKDINETCVRLGHKELESIYDLLKLIQTSLENPAKRLSWFKRDAVDAVNKAAGVSGYSESLGFIATVTEPVKALLDGAALVLRGISLDAWNKHNDRQTAVEANRMAILYAVNPEIKSRLKEDQTTLQQLNRNSNSGGTAGRRYENKPATESKVNPGMVVLVIIGILVVFGIIGSCNSSNSSSSSNSYSPPSTTSSDSSGKNVYRVPKYVSSELDREKAAIETDRAALRQLHGQVDSLARQIDSERIYLNNTSSYEVDAFNAKVRGYNALVQQSKAASAAFNARVDAYNAKLQQYGR